MSEDKTQIEIHVPEGDNKLLSQTLEIINNDEEIKTLWNVINTNAIQRMGYTDHGPVHFQIVANISLRILRLLVKHDVVPSIVKDFTLTNDHAELVVVLASLMHDLGMSVHREGHEEFSLFITNSLLRDMLAFLSVSERTIVTSEVLHSIISHRSGGKPLTVEAGVVRVADALDMSEGRSRIPYQKGAKDIHSISAAAIDNVEIHEGTKKPVEINILMNNAAGIFQVDELLKSKLKGSGIEQYISVKVEVKGATDKKLVREVNYE